MVDWRALGWPFRHAPFFCFVVPASLLLRGDGRLPSLHLTLSFFLSQYLAFAFILIAFFSLRGGLGCPSVPAWSSNLRDPRAAFSAGPLFMTGKRLASRPPAGMVALYANYTECGLRLPLSPFLAEVLRFCDISFSQLPPAAVDRLVTFSQLCRQSGVEAW